MTVRRIDDSLIALEGECPLEDAEALVQGLLDTPEASVDWRACDHAHAAVLQVLMASDANLLGPPKSAALAEISIAGGPGGAMSPANFAG